MPESNKLAQNVIKVIEELTNHKDYKGALTVEQMAECLASVNRNALSLASDAELLYSHQRYERALALAILSIEESSKKTIILCFFILFLNDKISPSKLWKDYRNHTAKSKGWMMPMMASLLEFKPLISSTKASDIQNQQMELVTSSEYARAVNLLKQRSLYCDFVDDGVAISPSDLPAEYLSEIFIRLAKFSSKKFQNPDLILLRLIKELCETHDFDNFLIKIKAYNSEYAILIELLSLFLSGKMNENSILSLLRSNLDGDNYDEKVLEALITAFNKSPLIISSISDEINHKKKE